MSTLYNKHNYLNKNINYIISNEIIEYDIKSAGFNIMKYFNLLDKDKIKKLEFLDKKQRQIQIGLYKKYDKSLSNKENERFKDIRKWFFEVNNLSDDDIISIKKDAIITTKRCLNTQLDNIEFVEKNIYTSYYYIDKKEFYYNKNTVDVKGINDEKLIQHREYMLDFLYTLFKMNEISKRNKIIDYIKEFSHYYKRKKLNVNYYRELNEESLFRLNSELYKNIIGSNSINDVSLLDISYNYLHFVIPLMRILV